MSFRLSYKTSQCRNAICTGHSEFQRVDSENEIRKCVRRGTSRKKKRADLTHPNGGVLSVSAKKTRPGGWGKTTQTLTVTNSVTATGRVSTRRQFVETKVRIFLLILVYCRLAVAKCTCVHVFGDGSCTNFFTRRLIFDAKPVTSTAATA